MRSKTQSKKTTNFLEGPVLSRILVFSLPIFLGMVFQTFYNLVDSIVVGKYVSADALAAVGTTSPISMLLVGMMTGFPVGASVVAAQFLGADQKEKIKPTISTTFWFLLIFSLILMAIGLVLSGSIMHWVNVPDNIYKDTVAYFRIYILGLLFMALYNFFAAFLRSVGDSTTPLIFLIISSVLNIFGDLFFVLVLHMGVAGVAWATVIAQGISVILCIFYTRRKSEYFQFKKGELVFDRDLFKDILRLGLPSGIQASITGIGFVMVQSLINSYGSVSIAAYTAASKMEQVTNLPMQGVAQGLALFIGQNIGAGKVKRAKSGLYRSAIFAVCVSALMSVLILFAGPYLMQLFVNQEDVKVIEVGADFMRIWAPLILLHALQECFVSFLRGAGDSVFSMISMFFDLITRMVMAYVFALGFKMGFMGIAWAIPCGWLLASICAVIRYFSGGWKSKSVIHE